MARVVVDVVLKPEILLYDEPTTGLDPIQTKVADDMIKETADMFGVTSCVISHESVAILLALSWPSPDGLTPRQAPCRYPPLSFDCSDFSRIFFSNAPSISA